VWLYIDNQKSIEIDCIGRNHTFVPLSTAFMDLGCRQKALLGLGESSSIKLNPGAAVTKDR